MEFSKLVPYVPQPMSLSAPTAPLLPSSVPTEQETLFSWLRELARVGIKTLPAMSKQLAIQLGIVVAVNLVLWPIKTYTLPAPLSSLVMLAVFLTATYNNVIPKTIYWVIVFTFGARLYKKIRKDGLAISLQPIRQLMPEIKQAYQALGERAQVLLLAGGGIGLIVANYFASYSRFSGARNKFDKYFVVLVVSFAVSYILGESKRGWLFKFGRLAAKDLSRALRRPIAYSDDYTFLILSGFVGGLLLDAPLIAMQLMYGGYILGVIALFAAFAWPRVRRTRRVS